MLRSVVARSVLLASVSPLLAVVALMVMVALTTGCRHGGPGASSVASPAPHAAVALPDAAADETADDDPSAMTTLRPALAPFGAWVVDERACTLWVPDASLVGDDFAPYLSDGHWTYANEGYAWIGDYAWSDITFHYGRWGWTEAWGWAWVPGALYAPSWVEWRYGEGSDLLTRPMAARGKSHLSRAPTTPNV
jgi:hypothetical protein